MGYRILSKIDGKNRSENWDNKVYPTRASAIISLDKDKMARRSIKLGYNKPSDFKIVKDKIEKKRSGYTMAELLRM